MELAILVDFGSTFTKATVVDVREARIVDSFGIPSTVGVDAEIGLDACFDRIKKEVGAKRFEQSKKLATSSAAGGLRMVVVGLTASLSIIAGKNAAFGAGAKILKSYAGTLTSRDLQEMESMNLEIILLCGGYDGGNIKTVRHNAAMLADLRSNGSVPIVYAGNSDLITEIRILLGRKHKELFVVNNIIPQVGVVDAGPAVGLIRNIFLERIVNMKGLGRVKAVLDSIVMPTPAAVLEAGELLALGCDGESGLGSLMIVDIGGATTDIHSYCDSEPVPGAKQIGVQEPYAKRTVEADLGMRESCGLTVREAGLERFARDLNMSVEQVHQALEFRLENIEFLPGQGEDSSVADADFDQQIACYACHYAARRHCGYVEAVFSKVCSRVQRGKNLASVETVIGTGGPVINSQNPSGILGEALLSDQDGGVNSLLPAKARLMVDADYVFYAAGMLRSINPEAALKIMKSSLRSL